MSLEIKPFNLRHASEAEYAALNVFQNQLRLERLPDDPPLSLQQDIAAAQNIPSFVDVVAWAVWEGERIVAGVNIAFLRMEQNQHLAQFDISILPELRRQGWGKRLLALAMPAVKRENKRLLMSNTNSNVPAGEAFMKRLGAEMGLAMRVNQLKLAELNRALVSEWVMRAPERAVEFELGSWLGPYPDAVLPAIADLMNVMNDQPRDNMDVEDMHFTPEHIKQMEEGMVKRGFEHWTLYVRDRATGELAGFTDVVWNPEKPELVNQGNTGVWPKYRNKGLGRWLKAAMLEKILHDRPQAKYIRTSNAYSNEPMLKINDELGFKEYMANLTWQVATEKVEAYLASKQ
jgi:GNAT superfamily N-acetyltransferase